MSTILTTDFKFPGQTGKYTGKVRDVYSVGDLVVMVATDRISAFDCVLPAGIPYKGQVLNQVAAAFLDATRDIVPNWKLATPDPAVTVGIKCEPYKVEMVIRGCLTGHAWREYQAGRRTLCGVPLPDGMKENQAFPEPIITPTTKAPEGHDMDISREGIIAAGIVPEKEYEQIERYTRALFERGRSMAAERGLILVDTKYEFGRKDGRILLMDEVHTPDSSRYFYREGYAERLERGERQRQLSKEFVREWLMSCGFNGGAGQAIPEMTPEIVDSISARYIELYEHLLGRPFVKSDRTPEQMRRKIGDCLASLQEKPYL